MAGEHLDKNIIALGVRQPWADLIVRGIKTVEVRSLNTNRRGTIYIYSAKKFSEHPAAATAADKHELDLDSLTLGMIVGTADLVDSVVCKPRDSTAACLSKSDLGDSFAWRLENARRFEKPLDVRFLPYGVWFYPYQRRNAHRTRASLRGAAKR